jgi:hypothetical protein
MGKRPVAADGKRYVITPALIPAFSPPGEKEKQLPRLENHQGDGLVETLTAHKFEAGTNWTRAEHGVQSLCENILNAKN